MKVLLSGASGFLGGKLCLALLAENFTVRALVRPSSDLSLPGSLYMQRGLENVLKAFADTETMKKLIYKSSYFAIGPTNGSIADESQMHHGKSFCTKYEKSKFLADQIALKAAESGVPIVILYPGFIYGPGKLTARNLLARTLIERFNWRLLGYIGKGHDISPLCHVDDVANGHIAALHKGKLGERYLLTGENASGRQIFDMAATITGTHRPFFTIPLWLVEIYGWISVLYSRITGTLLLISYPMVRVMRYQWAYACEKAKRDLGYSPRSLEEGLTEMISWLKSLKKIKY